MVDFKVQSQNDDIKVGDNGVDNGIIKRQHTSEAATATTVTTTSTASERHDLLFGLGLFVD